MKNKTFMIYGATGGIGSVLARQLVSEGAAVHLIARNEEKLSALGEELGMSWQAVDVEEQDSFARIADNAPDSLDGLVYAVGTINLKSLKRLEGKDYLRDFHLNAMGAALAVEAALPALQKGVSPAVVLLSSIAAQVGFAMHASMGMAKGAVSGLTVSLAAELAPKIRVNAVAPSLTQTPLASSLLANETMASALAKQHPLQRLGTAEDVASACHWLLREESAWMTGQILGLDGGRSTLAGK